MADKILAVAAGHEITEAEFAEFTKRIPAQQQEYLKTDEGRRQALTQYANYFLFEQLGRDRGYDKEEEYIQVLEGTARELLGQCTLTQEVKDLVPSEAQCRDYYEKNKDRFRKGAQANARHILVDDEEKAKEILAMIEAGDKSFEDAAKEFSTCPSSQKGGDLGTFGPGQMVAEFDQAVFSAKEGDLLGPVKTQFGFHLIRVEKLTEAGQAPFEEVAAQIMQQLANEMQNEKYMQLRSEMIEKYGLTFAE